MAKTRGNKPAFVEAYVLRKVKKVKVSGSKAPIRIYSRKSTILPNFVGLNFEVHNGKIFMGLFIQDSMIGYKFGEFVKTRFFKAHGGKKDKTGAKEKSGASKAKPAAGKSTSKPASKTAGKPAGKSKPATKGKK